MKSKLLVLLALLAIPAIASPDNGYTSSCTPQLAVPARRSVEGEAIPGQTVELVVPCMSKADLRKVLVDLAPKLQLNYTQINALRKGKDIRVLLSTELLTRQDK